MGRIGVAAALAVAVGGFGLVIAGATNNQHTIGSLGVLVGITGLTWLALTVIRGWIIEQRDREYRAYSAGWKSRAAEEFAAEYIPSERKGAVKPSSPNQARDTRQ
ncbi:hypothetical protein [Embleya scabrispora]|uniref:hypothetical protein n=1 Tax=Embleya scabrispora TaxID=159449 RepID=UPI00117D4F95|nr:hypothetical protein [Embleya scabrispora]